MIKLNKSNQPFFYKFGKPGVCTYCGEYADTVDHCVPYSITRQETKQNSRHKLIGFCCPSCGECNSLLGDKLFLTFQERLLFVNKQLKKKYSRHHVVWDNEEIDELEGNLQKYVSGSNIDYLISKDRILWIHTPDFMKIYNEVIDDLYGNEKISKQLKSFFIDDDED